MLFIIPIIAIAILVWAIDVVYFSEIPEKENNETRRKITDDGYLIEQEYLENYILK